MLASTASRDKAPSSHTVAREAFFLEFARAIRSEIPTTPLMVTGGFRTRQGMISAVKDNDACDLIGLGRPAVLEPTLPKDIIFNPEVPDEKARLTTQAVAPSWTSKVLGIKGVGAGAETVSFFSFFFFFFFWLLDCRLTRLPFQ